MTNKELLEEKVNDEKEIYDIVLMLQKLPEEKRGMGLYGKLGKKSLDYLDKYGHPFSVLSCIYRSEE